MARVSIEIRSALFFAGLAFSISFIIGLLAGINIATVTVRSLFALPIFGAIGFGAVTAIKRFVPEMFAVAVNVEKKETAEDDGAPGQDELQEMEDEAVSSGHDDERQDDSGHDESAFTEMGAGDLSGDTVGQYAEGLDELSPQGDGTKMGKHIVANEDFNYEPKLMAEAIRTIMSRDEE